MNNNDGEQQCVLVCVTDPKSCGRLIEAGKEIADSSGRALRILSVLPEGDMSDSTSAIMQQLYDISAENSAQITFHFTNEPALTAAVHASQIRAGHIVTGTPSIGSNMFLETIKSLLPELPVSVIDADNRMYTFPAFSVARV